MRDVDGHWGESLWLKIENLIEIIQDSIAEVTEKISNIRYTEDSGFNFSASTSIYSYNVQGGTVEDTLGNTGVLYSYAGGVSTGSPSV